MNVRGYRKLSRRLEMLGYVAAHVWNLPLKLIRLNEALCDAFGRCWYHKYIIELRLTTLKDPPRLLPDWHLLDTLAHEIAHLKEHGHTKAHRALRDAIKVWLKLNWYRNFNKPRARRRQKQSRKKRPR